MMDLNTRTKYFLFACLLSVMYWAGMGYQLLLEMPNGKWKLLAISGIVQTGFVFCLLNLQWFLPTWGRRICLTIFIGWMFVSIFLDRNSEWSAPLWLSLTYPIANLALLLFSERKTLFPSR